jgi:hypothetical protein
MSQLLINKNTQRPSKMTVGILPLAGDPLSGNDHRIDDDPRDCSRRNPLFAAQPLLALMGSSLGITTVNTCIVATMQETARSLHGGPTTAR